MSRSPKGRRCEAISGQGRRFRQPEPAVYRKILQQAERNGDDFCIPPRRGRWLLSQPGESKFAAKKPPRTDPNRSIMLGEEKAAGEAGLP